MTPSPPTSATISLDRLTRIAPQPLRVLMTVDAVGGVWRYAMDLGRVLSEDGAELTFAGFGPQASQAQRREAESIGEFVETGAPLDWLVDDERALTGIGDVVTELALSRGVDLVHLNLPSQAAGLRLPVPVVVVSHSCVVTWFRAVRGTSLPDGWAWQERWNCAGFRAADAIIAPSRSHAEMLTACYGPLPGLDVVHNASSAVPSTSSGKEPFVLAAGRWWDEGKNGMALDRAAADIVWPVLMAGSCRGPNGQVTEITRAKALDEIPYPELQALMRRAAIVASPSIYEPFGLAALEGALNGAALVLADIPTYRELWDGAATFADPRDPAAFAAAINDLAEHPRRRAGLGRAARERAGRYTTAAQAIAVRRIYDIAIERHRGALELAS